MPTVSAAHSPVFDMGNAVITGLVSPSRGAHDVAAWRIRFGPDVPSPTHSLTREETFLVLSGTLDASYADHVETAGPGDALIVPAGVEFCITASRGPAEAICVMPVGGEAVTAQGTFVPPWAQ